MLKLAVLSLCLATVWSLQCYKCDTKDDDVLACNTVICNGLKSVCYKREYSFDGKDKQYEERGCVENKDYLEGTCKKNLGALTDAIDGCKIYTCDDNRCNSSLSFTASLSLLSAVLFYCFI